MPCIMAPKTLSIKLPQWHTTVTLLTVSVTVHMDLITGTRAGSPQAL